jgi:lipopolysaccharide/colanic/teichoic acid biosynthesis glycosyltransferase
MTKRLFDIVFSAAAFIFLLPVFLVLACIIKCTSPGPVFFRQERVGRGQVPFRIFKFRTMRTESLPGRQVTAKGDPRITPVGSVLRTYKLDELPQFINVLTGDMSLVGPRPEVPKYLVHYSEDQRRRIFSVRPGITDECSIVFRDEEGMLGAFSDPEAAYVSELLPRKLALQSKYAETQTFLGDLRLIARTIMAVFRR